MSFCLINKTRFYTHQAHTRERLVSKIDDGYRLWTSSSSVFSSRLFFEFSASVDDVEEKKKPRECGSTTNNQAGKEWTQKIIMATRDGSSGYIWYARRAEAERQRREVLLRRQYWKSKGDTTFGCAIAWYLRDWRFWHDVDHIMGFREVGLGFRV